MFDKRFLIALMDFRTVIDDFDVGDKVDVLSLKPFVVKILESIQAELLRENLTDQEFCVMESVTKHILELTEKLGLVESLSYN